MMNNQNESVYDNEETSGLIMVVHASNFIVGGKDNLPVFQERTSSCLSRVHCCFFVGLIVVSRSATFTMSILQWLFCTIY